jgi:hypothetical protein
MHQSSSLTLIYKYLFPLLIGGSMLAIVLLPPDGNTEAEDTLAPVLLTFLCAMIWLIIFAVRLKSVTATQSHLSVSSFNGDWKIDYKDIEYISEAVLINPRLITLKYRNTRTGESDVILIMPSTTSEMFRFKFLQEHDMTQYIREQILIHNPNYSKDSEPSRWRTLAYFTLSILGVLLIGALVSLGVR